MNKKEAIADYLKQKYSAVAVVLYGSRATESYTEYSDWDIFMISNTKEHEVDDFAEYREFEGEQLEVSVISLEEAKSDSFIFDTAMHPVEQIEVLLDQTDGLVDQIITRTEKAHAQRPQNDTMRMHELRLKILRKFLFKVKARPGQSEVVFFATAQFFNFATRYWFETHDLWPQPVHSALKTIEVVDVKFAESLRSLYEAGSVDSKIAAMEFMYSKIKDAREF